MSLQRSFEELECWQRATDLQGTLSRWARELPDNETALLSFQLRKTARAVTDQLAEGFGRFNFQESLQYARQARGALFVLLNQVLTAKQEGHFDEEQEQIFRGLFEDTLTSLNGYIKFLGSSARNQRGGNTYGGGGYNKGGNNRGYSNDRYQDKGNYQDRYQDRGNSSYGNNYQDDED